MLSGQGCRRQIRIEPVAAYDVIRDLVVDYFV